jgi:cyclic beta-1,2-glucan glucanotransferase
MIMSTPSVDLTPSLTKRAHKLRGQLIASAMPRPQNRQFIRHAARQLEQIRSSSRSLLLVPRSTTASAGCGGEVSGTLKPVVEGLLQNLAEFHDLPSTAQESGGAAPRIYRVAQAYLAAVGFRFSAESYITFLRIVQERVTLRYSELKMLIPAMQMSAILSLLPLPHRKSDWSLPPVRLLDIHAVLEMLVPADTDRLISELLSFEPLLEKDPAGLYIQQDVYSRNIYRRAVESVAVQYGLEPDAICTAALFLAGRELIPIDVSMRLTCSLGYYLLDDSGIDILLKHLEVRPHSASPRIPTLNASVYLYFGLTVILGLGTSAIWIGNLQSFSLKLIGILASCLISSSAAQDLMALYKYYWTAPRCLPRLDLSSGIPARFKTIVAVPALLLDAEQAASLIRVLEQHFAATADPNVYFVLLTDFADSSTPAVTAGQKQVLELCSNMVDELNARPEYVKDKPFCLLHRDHRFCATEAKWIGWERKRGKLLELISYSRSGINCFSHRAGNTEQLIGAAYMVTLDEDTKITRHSIQRLVGAHIHPLNQPHLNDRKILERGYGVLQPAMALDSDRIAEEAVTETRLRRDFCQDCFGETMFLGKGIINLDIFAALVEGVLPEQRILSHDLIEGSLARTGAVPDIVFLESVPSSYSIASRRMHRWLRGDWQNLIWLLSTSLRGRRIMPAFGVMLIIQKACLSLVPVALLMLLMISTAPGMHLVFVILVMLLLGPRMGVVAIRALNAYKSGQSPFKSLGKDSVMLAVSALAYVACSAHDAIIVTDAAFRAVFRSITGRKLLEWNTFISSERNKERNSILQLYEYEWLAAILVGVIALASGGMAIPVRFLPLLALWCLRPGIQKMVGQVAASRERNQ